MYAKIAFSEKVNRTSTSTTQAAWMKSAFRKKQCYVYLVYAQHLLFVTALAKCQNELMQSIDLRYPISGSIFRGILSRRAKYAYKYWMKHRYTRRNHRRIPIFFSHWQVVYSELVGKPGWISRRFLVDWRIGLTQGRSSHKVNLPFPLFCATPKKFRAVGSRRCKWNERTIADQRFDGVESEKVQQTLQHAKLPISKTAEY